VAHLRFNYRTGADHSHVKACPANTITHIAAIDTDMIKLSESPLTLFRVSYKRIFIGLTRFSIAWDLNVSDSPRPKHAKKFMHCLPIIWDVF
jgi:hypothetical protein